MADVAPVDPVEATPAADVEMGDDTAEAQAEGGEDTAGLGEIEPEVVTRTSFLDYLKSPVVQLIVGKGADQNVLSAHEAVLLAAPYFAERCAHFKPKQARKIDLSDEDTEAVGSILEFLYNGEYFPKRLAPDNKESPLETDPTLPSPDNKGVGLLRHARIYTLAEKLGLPALKSLAHTKIHRTSSTAKGEIAYARYVYQNTSNDDNTIRRPVAAFWATRSHILRHEAESEFRNLCLEFPQFGFDVLSLVLDRQEKKTGGSGALVEISAPQSSSTPARAGRKRARQD